MGTQVPVGDGPLEPCPTVEKQRNEKIRRPPNAFMLFAKDHRKIIASRHPDVSNKVVSSMLGKFWKNAAQNVKEKYFKQAKMLDEQHKLKYPDYVYSPREARLQKMNRKKKKDVIPSTSSTVNTEDLNIIMKESKNEEKVKEENWVTSMEQDTQASPGYVPNNPEYFAQETLKSDDEDSPDQQSCNQYPSQQEFSEGQTNEMPMNIDHGRSHNDISFRRPMTAENYGCCTRDRLETEETCNTSFVKPGDGTLPYFPNPVHCSYSTPSSFCNTSAPYPGQMSSFCCGHAPYTSQLSQPYRPPFDPYWGSSLMNPHFYRNRSCFYKDIKTFPFRAPYHGPELYRASFEYFNRNMASHGRHPNYGFYPYVKESWDCFRQFPSEFVVDTPEAHPYIGRPNENLSNLYGCSSTSGEGLCLQRGNQLQTDEQSNEHSASVNESDSEPPEISNSHSSTCGVEPSPLNRLGNQYGMNSQTHPPVPEGKRKEIQVKECFSGNRSPYDSSRNKNEEYLAGCKLLAEMSESKSNSFTSPCARNISDCLKTEEDNLLEIPDEKFCKPPNCVSPQSTKLSYIKSITGINPLFTTAQFQEVCNRPPQLMRNTLIRMPFNYIKKTSAAKESDSSFKGIDCTINNNINNQNTHLQSLCTDDEMHVQSLKASDSDSVNLQEVKTDDCTLNCQPQFPHPLVKHEPHFSSSTEYQSSINKNISASKKVTIKSDDQNYSQKMIMKSDDIYKVASRDQYKVKDGNQRYTNSSSDAYAKNLDENLKARLDSKNTTELHLNKRNLRCMEQNELPKIYYEQNDGSYVAEEKFNVLKGNVQCKLILNNSIVIDKKQETKHIHNKD